MKKSIILFTTIILCISLSGCGIYIDNSENIPSTHQAETENILLEDGAIQGTNIFTIEKQIKSTTGYHWSDDHSVIEGRTGYLGTLLCEEKDIWCDLYGNDLEEITLASIDVFEEDFDLLITFVSFFDTNLIDTTIVQQWLKDNKSSNESSKIFGDAEFSLFYGEADDNKYSLYITALE